MEKQNINDHIDLPLSTVKKTAHRTGSQAKKQMMIFRQRNGQDSVEFVL
jgi:hypothetical protein